jgi:hypothetical protein
LFFVWGKFVVFAVRKHRFGCQKAVSWRHVRPEVESISKLANATIIIAKYVYGIMGAAHFIDFVLNWAFHQATP